MGSQVNTAHQLEVAHWLAGHDAKAEDMAKIVKRKMADITEVLRQKSVSQLCTPLLALGSMVRHQCRRT